MKSTNPFFDEEGRLRSGWRVVVFVIAFFAVLYSLLEARRLALRLTPISSVRSLLASYGFIVILFAIAMIVGWACNRWLERLPLRALGWAFHHRWWRDWLIGSLLGAASLLIATAIAMLAGGLRFNVTAPELFPLVLKILVISAVVFICAAAAEQVTYWGYPFQTLLRAHCGWVAVILSSAVFAWYHMGNPNVVPMFTFINTALAGVWFSVAYLRTRSLWFPLGLHWAWNWIQGGLLGLPVSGRAETVSLLRATDFGPAWLTGGAYGIEGGIACTAALILSIIFIWRTRLVAATDEMAAFTSKEHHKHMPPLRVE
jgi:membrane protease YdiL (CAAX protease family)